MAGMGIADLPLPPPEYRPDRQFGRKPMLESPVEALDEDEIRERMLAKVGHLELAEELAQFRPQTLASKWYMLARRIRVSGHLWKLLASSDPVKAATFTVIPQGWTFRSDELDQQNPSQLIEAFRVDLNRAGAAHADGWLAAFLHGEHEPQGERYQLHLHGVATGGMIDVLERLRKRPKYASSRSQFDPGDGAVCQRLRISQKPLTDLPRPLTYLLQSWWPSRWIGTVGDDGIVKRSRRRSRIAEPAHSQYLLWLHRWALSDITLLMKLRVTRAGFQASGASTNGAKS